MNTNKIELTTTKLPVAKGERLITEAYGDCIAIADGVAIEGGYSVQVRRLKKEEATAIDAIEAMRDLLRELAPGLEGRGVNPTRFLNTPKNRAVIRARAIVAKHEGRVFIAPYLHEA